MRKHSVFWITCISLLLLTACNAVPPLPTGSSTANENEDGTTSRQVARRTPQQTVEDFMAAWANEDFATMYRFVSPRTEEVYSFDDFQTLYQNTHAEMAFAGVSYTLRDTRIQGTSAAVTHNITLESDTFGTIRDNNRIMRLVESDGGWQVAWSPMDIINGMTSSVRLQYIPTFPQREGIYDRNGQPLAESGASLSRVYMREQDMSNIDECIDILAEAMLRPRYYFTQLFANYLPDSVFYVGEIDNEIYQRYRNQLNTVCGADINTPFGSKVITSTGRNYYGHGAAAHVTGYIGRVPGDQLSLWQSRGYRASDIVGLAGIENAMEQYLAGSPERSLRLIDSSGITLRELGGTQGEQAIPVQLTIDRDLQYAMAKAFNDAWNYAAPNWVTVATGGAGVVLDVNSGAVLAMVSYPTFDPRIFNPSSTYSLFGDAQAEINRAVNGTPLLPTGAATINRAISEQFAPGSTFKIATAVAAADSGIWNPNDNFMCDLIWEGTEYGDSQPFREDWRVVSERDAAGLITMSQALTASCNPFFWEVGARMYQEDPLMLRDYSMMLGLGTQTGIRGLQREAEGNMPAPANVTEALNNAIGQGNTSTNVLQMANMVAAMANEGTLYQPYLIDRIGGFRGTALVEDIEPQVVRELDVEPFVYNVVKRGMCAAVTDTELGTANRVFGDAPYSSCGKTGTAQATIAPHAWYVAYAPADDPQVAVAVMVTNSREGSEVAAPITRRILDAYFNAPEKPFPEWWEEDYIPVEPPRGTLVSGN